MKANQSVLANGAVGAKSIYDKPIGVRSVAEICKETNRMVDPDSKVIYKTVPPVRVPAAESDAK
jgi:hypothetical protein